MHVNQTPTCRDCPSTATERPRRHPTIIPEGWIHAEQGNHGNHGSRRRTRHVDGGHDRSTASPAQTGIKHGRGGRHLQSRRQLDRSRQCGARRRRRRCARRSRYDSKPSRTIRCVPDGRTSLVWPVEGIYYFWPF